MWEDHVAGHLGSQEDIALLGVCCGLGRAKGSWLFKRLLVLKFCFLLMFGLRGLEDFVDCSDAFSKARFWKVKLQRFGSLHPSSTETGSSTF